jgi:RsiW-degrading membrane proteinase PrsW (M82 family)
MDVPGLLLTAAACLGPPLLFLAFVAGRDRPRRPRARWLALLFSGGMFAAAVGYFVFVALDLLPAYESMLAGHSAVDLVMAAYVLGVVGPIEEALKLATVVVATRVLGFRSRPRDAIVHVAAASLGFAAAENWYAMYATGGPDAGRAAVVPFVHLLFAGFTGWGLARSRQAGGRAWPVYGGLALAAAYHGLYDILEFRGGWWHFATMPLVVLLWYFLNRSLGDLAAKPRKP